MLFKSLIAINILLIMVSLASGLFFLSRDSSEKTRVVRSLTVRVVLSISLILLLVIGYYTGAITPNAVM
ncbi:twin transmembrane helix small protein [Aestuariirhabdus litorea]|uniref:Twin transmembrane helix small protein n=1 Tax=Aestuariirhabdus litorea TaxID=2528527 RepID=A0A3P3VLG8_9GAMM|nr:twin transmembrane helix small protein [Aestuariirhabdus litorea]RRJ82566.1 twin transmembrane helix small protein [Aestuariirhabdus litorea]RWW92725.1 twin transmembrane helix small protein [Endozoicomonadaceae bacterium GTF-13]